MKEIFDNGRSKRVSEVVIGDESWIYQYDPKTKQQSEVWCFHDEAPPTKVQRSKSAGKAMVISFFRKTGHVATVVLEERQTVTASWYVTVCVPQVLETLNRQRTRTDYRGLLWHHDNEPAQSASRAVGFMAE